MATRLTRFALVVGGVLLAACNTTLGPGGDLDLHYVLTSVDGAELPAPSSEAPDGWTVEYGALTFPRGRPRDASSYVGYALLLRAPDGTGNISRVDLEYTVEGNTLTINLCPPLALCIAPSFLIGEIRDTELRLTHYLADRTRSVYRFESRGFDLPE